MISPISSSITLSARFQLNQNQTALAETLKRLATGRKINSGKDDPAGLISSEQLKAEIKALEAATKSLRRADSNVRIAEGHAAELSTLFQDLNSLVVAGANQAGMSDAEIAANQLQIDSTVESIHRFAGDAFDSLSGFNMPNGGNSDVEALYNDALTAATSVRTGGANALSTGNFEAAQTAVQEAALSVATARGRLGAFQRYDIDPQIRSNQVAIENVTASRSRIVDTDFAEETSNLAQQQVLVAAAMQTLKLIQQQSGSILDLLA